jgi:hypothetical protein
METDWKARYWEINDRHAAVNHRRQEDWRQQELIAQYKRHNDLLEQHHHGGRLILLVLALLLGMLALLAYVIVRFAKGLAWLLAGR